VRVFQSQGKDAWGRKENETKRRGGTVLPGGLEDLNLKSGGNNRRMAQQKGRVSPKAQKQQETKKASGKRQPRAKKKPADKGEGLLVVT